MGRLYYKTNKALLWGRLSYHGVGPARTVPTLWIVLGPLGQSITATGLLAHAAPTVIPKPYSTAMQALAVLYGIPVWGFAIIWLTVAAAITLGTARQHLPFSLCAERDGEARGPYPGQRDCGGAALAGDRVRHAPASLRQVT